MLNHPVIRQIREQLDRLKHLENIECVPPMRKDETLGVGITFSVDDLTAARDADAAVIQIETTAGVNYYFDSTIQVRETDGTWSDGEAIWALDLESASSLTLGNRYIAVAVRDEFGNTVSEAQGPYYVSIDVGYGHALSDTAWWIKVVGSLTPASWSGVTAYVVGNLVVSGGIDYVCISAHTNHVPPNATYWVPLVLNDAGAYNGSKAYVAGDYVRELRRLWAFSSATGGGGSSGSITTDSGTATGPDYTFAQSGVIAISATGSTVTFDVPTTPPPIYVQGGIYEPFIEVTFDNPIPAWSSGTTYDIGEIVDVSGTTYISTKTANTNHNPSTPNPSWWASVGSTASLQGKTRWLIGEGGGFPNGGTFAGLIHNGTQTFYGLKTFAFGEVDVYSEANASTVRIVANSTGISPGVHDVVSTAWISVNGVDSNDITVLAGVEIFPAATQGSVGSASIKNQSLFVFDGGYTSGDDGVTGWIAPPNPSYALRVYPGGPGVPTTYTGAWATVSGLVFKGGLYISGSLDVDNLAYTPATSSNWGSSPPSTIVDAIDLISTIVNAYIPTNAPKSYSVPGTYDRIISTDGDYEIKCYGGGGGGGGGSAGTGGDGGGGGEYASETVALRVGDVITIVVGDGGAGGTAGNSGVGGTSSSVASRAGSSFTTVTANGGSGGAPSGLGTGGQGGTGSTNTTHTDGGNGATGNGTNGGTGGASGLQSGAAGGTGSNTGSAGTSGAGGGGGGPTNGVGGAGGNGVVIIEKV